LLCALAPSVAALTAWRFVQGFAGGGGIVLARAVAADLTSGVAAARLFSLFMTLSSVAPIAAPVAGGALLAWTGDWRVDFHVLAFLNAGLALAIWRTIPETLPAGRRRRGGLRQTARAFTDLVRDRLFLGYALTVALAYASLFGYISGSSFALQQHYGLSATQFSAVFAVNAAGMVVFGLINARLVSRFTVRRLLVVGLAVSAAAAAVLVLGVTAGAALGLGAVLPALFVVVATRGLVSSNATVLAVERGAAAAGSASAVLGAFMFGGGILVTPLLGLGPEGSPVPMALVVAGGAVAALLATVLLTRSTAAPALSAR
jgi:DHA1 family bicyclomycin/chloramphenicol resistance-like MFS transporter